MNRSVLLLAAVAASAVGAASRPARAADPTTADCLAASESSLAMRNDHRLRAARAQLLVCSAASCPGDIRAECIRRVAEINAAMPTIVFEAKDPAGHDLTTVKVTMDGEPIAERLEGIALSIDPGEHTFGFETPGQPAVQQRLVIREGEKDRRERIAFGAPASAAAGASTTLGGAGTPAVAASGREPLGGQRIGALAAAGAGVVGVAIGIVFGLDAISKHHDASQTCPAQCPDQRGVDLWNQAVSAGNVSTVAFVVGAAGLAGGAILWFTAKPGAMTGERPATTVGLGPGSLLLRGTW